MSAQVWRYPAETWTTPESPLGGGACLNSFHPADAYGGDQCCVNLRRTSSTASKHGRYSTMQHSQQDPPQQVTVSSLTAQLCAAPVAMWLTLESPPGTVVRPTLGSPTRNGSVSRRTAAFWTAPRTIKSLWQQHLQAQRTPAGDGASNSEGTGVVHSRGDLDDIRCVIEPPGNASLASGVVPCRCVEKSLKNACTHT